LNRCKAYGSYVRQHKLSLSLLRLPLSLSLSDAMQHTHICLHTSASSFLRHTYYFVCGHVVWTRSQPPNAYGMDTLATLSMHTLETTQPHAHATLHALHAHRCELATTLPRAHPPCVHAHPRFHGAGWTRWLRRQAEAIRSREASRSNTLTFQCTPTFHLNLGSRPYVIGATKLVAYDRGLALDEPLPVCLNRAFRRQPLVEPLPVRHE